MAGLFIGSVLYMPFVATRGGWLLGTERDASVMREADEYCPPDRLDPVTNKCRRSIRSYYYNRPGSGGGWGFGK